MRDQTTSNRVAELTAPTRIGSGAWLAGESMTMKTETPRTDELSGIVQTAFRSTFIQPFLPLA